MPSPNEIRLTHDAITFDPKVYNLQTLSIEDAIAGIDVTNNIITKKEIITMLDNLSKRIYEIIDEHTAIDISEEEFMKILKEGN